ncbi:MAG TPA: MAPEG family protein [Burkholderiaceae bacterium]|nr:MAPEG family protein [Burkholderiaceae bacterium]
MHPVALICTAVLGALVFGLGFAISGTRFARRRLSGHPDDPRDLLHRLVRAHGNATEYAPFLAVLFLYFGAQDPDRLTVALIVGATVARVLHAAGLIAWPGMDRPNPLRFLGAIGTYLCGAALSVILLFRTQGAG